MAEIPFDQLTDAQRECLRLVLAHHNSKEIAKLVGVSASAVDKRLERAVMVLGAPSRFAAARMLSTHEGGPASDRLPSEPIDVPSMLQPAPTIAKDEPWGLVRRLLGLGRSAGRDGEVRNKLSWPMRLVVAAALTVVVALVATAVINMGQTVSVIALRQSGYPSR